LMQAEIRWPLWQWARDLPRLVGPSVRFPEGRVELATRIVDEGSDRVGSW